MTTTRQDLINRIDESTGCTHKLVKAVAKEFTNEIKLALAGGNRIKFRDCGLF